MCAIECWACSKDLIFRNKIVTPSAVICQSYAEEWSTTYMKLEFIRLHKLHYKRLMTNEKSSIQYNYRWKNKEEYNKRKIIRTLKFKYKSVHGAFTFYFPVLRSRFYQHKTACFGVILLCYFISLSCFAHIPSPFQLLTKISLSNNSWTNTKQISQHWSFHFHVTMTNDNKFTTKFIPNLPQSQLIW